MSRVWVILIALNMFAGLLLFVNVMHNEYDKKKIEGLTAFCNRCYEEGYEAGKKQE